MKKKINILAITILLFNYTYSQQNLVQNPSFESYTACPQGPDEIHKSINWSSYANSPDYFHSCGAMSVPINWGGYQQASSGQAYAAFATRGDKTIGGNNLREFIGGQLSSSLSIGTKYFISLNISLTVEPSISANCATNKVGVNFSKVPFTVSNPALVTNNAKVYSNTIITDTVNWTKLFGSFIADSSYNYVIIGNFFDDNNTDTLILDGDTHCSGAYYYVDDICVSTDSLFTLNYATVGLQNQVIKNIFFDIFPNPSYDFMIIHNFTNSLYRIDIDNILGETIFSQSNLHDTQFRILLTDLHLGVYLVKIKTEKSEFIYKLIKQ